MWSARIGGQSVKVIYLAKPEIDQKKAHIHIQLEDSIIRVRSSPSLVLLLYAERGCPGALVESTKTMTTTTSTTCRRQKNRKHLIRRNTGIPRIHFSDNFPHSGNQMPLMADRRKCTQWNRSDSSSVFCALVCRGRGIFWTSFSANPFRLNLMAKPLKINALQLTRCSLSAQSVSQMSVLHRFCCDRFAMHSIPMIQFVPFVCRFLQFALSVSGSRWTISFLLLRSRSSITVCTVQCVCVALGISIYRTNARNWVKCHLFPFSWWKAASSILRATSIHFIGMMSHPHSNDSLCKTRTALRSLQNAKLFGFNRFSVRNVVHRMG